MTGTPIENRLGELWAIMDIVNPGLLGSRDWFDRTFARPIEACGDEQALERLRSIVQPFILRRAKDSPEVELELPPITIAKDYCRLTVEQASLYQATVDRWMPRDRGARRPLRPARRGARDAQPAEAGLQPPGDAARRPGRRSTAAPASSSGWSSCSSRCRRATRRSSSRSTPASTGSCRTSSSGSARRVGFFHGRLNARQRDELLASFATEDGPSVLVISIKAGGRGLNLPAANHVIHFDRWWNPAVEQQATDRVHRFGQRKHVFVHSLICTGTLEERIDQLLESKRELAEKVIAGRAEDWLGELDLGAIRAAVALSPDPWRRRPSMSERLGERAVGAALRERGRPRRRARRSPSAAACSCAEERSATVEVTAGNARGERRRRATVTIAAEPVPPRIWTAMARFARGNRRSRRRSGPRAVGAARAPDDEDWSEPLVPRASALGATCTCDADGACEHVAALAYAVAQEIDRDPSLLLRWRGCEAEDEIEPRELPPLPLVEPEDAWAAGPLPEPRPLRPLPAGAVLKRLGPSGLRVGGDDLADVLQRAYASFAASPRR